MRIHNAQHFDIYTVILVLLLSACANVVAPTGGPRDEDPPVVTRSIPPNYSTRYEGQDVRIFFDEFVELKEFNQNFLVSPPLDELPEVRIRGRSIIMSLTDTLEENTTYVFYFGESIADITEGNAIPNFRFVASTGDYVDSLSVSGRVKNALTLEPEDGVFVMLYDNIYDSVPMLERPIYISKTNPEGEFLITNMREGEYLLFALRDMNFNYKYDNPEEKIAFIDSLITPQFVDYSQLALLDSILQIDTLSPENNATLDTLPQNGVEALKADSLRSLADSLSAVLSEVDFYEMYMFQEEDTLQRILSASVTARGKITLEFRIPADSVVVRQYKDPIEREWFIPEYSIERDSLILWFHSLERDSLFLEISDRGKIIDSLKLSTTVRQPRGRRAPVDTVPAPLAIRAGNLTSGGVLPYYRQLILTSQTPLETFNTELISFFVSDSIALEPEFRFIDTVKRKLELTNILEPDSSYRLEFLPGSFQDIFGHVNDSLQIRFRTNNAESYGSILVNIQLPKQDEQYILQLLNPSFELIKEMVITQDQVYKFQHLSAGSYKLRLVWDKNRNEKWDTGNYLRGIQPELVYMFSDQVQTRLNWEVEVIWNLSSE